MTTATLERRVAALETEVAQMKEQLAKTTNEGDWLDDFYGAFAGDPHFAEAMRLGREYRESLRPKARRKAAATAAKKRAKKSVKGRRL